MTIISPFVGEGWHLTLGLIFLVIVILLPGGLMEGARRIRTAWTRRWQTKTEQTTGSLRPAKAESGGWNWPWRWSSTHAYCCWTSPPPAWSRHDTNSTIDLLNKIKEHGMTKVIIAHDMHVVFSLTDRITVLVQGRIIADGAPIRRCARPISGNHC